MEPLPLDIPAGFLKVDSLNAGMGRYTDGDHVLFLNGRPEKWPGWRLFLADSVLGIARGATSWVNQHGNTNAAIGTNLKLYSITGDDTLTDITPIRSTVTINNNPFATQSGSAVVTVTDTAHGADDGAFVTFSGATAVAGITISGEYQLTFVDADTYTITHSAAANATTSGGGASVTAAYQINPGTGSGVLGLGWGAGSWGRGTWSTPRTSGITLDLRYWSCHEYGNDLLACPSQGSLYLWEEATDVRAEAVANAPASIRYMFVTPERFVFALGAGPDATTPMTVRWPDQDDITVWTPALGNTANIRTLQTGSKLMAGCALSDGVSLVWSDTALYVFQYTGSEFVYDSRLAGTHCGLVAPGAFAKVSGVAYWMSGHAFHVYSGGVGAIARSADVEDFVFRDIDPDQITKTWCQYIQPSNQVRWHYVSNDSATTEPDKYVDVCLDDFSWTTGTFDGVTATPYRPADSSSLFVTASGAIHEFGVGKDADTAPLAASLNWGLYALGRGKSNMDIMGIVPDCARQAGDLTFAVTTYDRPNASAAFDSATAALDEDDEIADLRVSGRHFTMTATSNELGGDFRLGIVTLEVGAAGERR